MQGVITESERLKTRDCFVERLKPEDLQTVPQLPLPAVVPQCRLCDETYSDALVAW